MNANTEWKPALAELVGTFLLVFIGAGAGALAGAPPAGNGGGIVSVALAHGIALLVIVYAFGIISGAHVNPARTLGPAVVTGDLSYLWIYIVGPAVGAVAAALLYHQVFLPMLAPAPQPLTRKQRRS